MDNPEKLAAYDAQDELFKRPQKIPNLTQGLDTGWYTYRDTFCTQGLTPGGAPIVTPFVHMIWHIALHLP